MNFAKSELEKKVDSLEKELEDLKKRFDKSVKLEEEDHDILMKVQSQTRKLTEYILGYRTWFGRLFFKKIPGAEIDMKK